MRIGIDARLNAYRHGGIAEYTRQLLAALAPLAPQDTLLTFQHREHLRPLVVAPNVSRTTLFTPPHHRLEAWALPLELLRLRLDLIHFPDFIAPRWRSCPAVVTIHDLAFLYFPEILDAHAQRYYGQVRTSVQYADAVIAVSQATRRDIAHLLDLPPERVDVVYEAAAPIFAPMILADAEMRQINQHVLRAGSFLLFVSTLEPRKNLPTLLHALRACRDRQPGTAYSLVVAGPRGWQDQAIFDAIRDLRLTDMVTLLGHVDQADLRWLYNASVMYLNPSRYEGFGLPVLEALACGAATVVSDVSSLPEIVGDAALLIPPEDVLAWAEVIERVWHDGDLRYDLEQRGPRQAAKFSWQRCAEETLAIYQRVTTMRS